MSDAHGEPWTPGDAHTYATGLLVGRVCRLRGLRTADIDRLVRWRASMATEIFQSDSLNPLSESKLRDFITALGAGSPSGDSRGFCVETIPRGDDQAVLLGIVSLSQMHRQSRSAEFAIALDPAQGGHGYGQDAARIMLRYGFRELGLHRIQLHAWAYNARAVSTYRKAGFVEEGRLRDTVFHDGRWHDEYVMSVLSTDSGALD